MNDNAAKKEYRSNQKNIDFAIAGLTKTTLRLPEIDEESRRKTRAQRGMARAPPKSDIWKPKNQILKD